MSVDFYPAVVEVQPNGSRLITFAVDRGRRCTCPRMTPAEQVAWVNSDSDEPLPQCDLCRERDLWSLHLSNRNAYDLCAWLDVPEDERQCGDLSAVELTARCRRRLWSEVRNVDPSLPTAVDAAPGRATVIYGGRDDGYLRHRTQQLLNLVERSMARFGAEVLFSWA